MDNRALVTALSCFVLLAGPLTGAESKKKSNGKPPVSVAATVPPRLYDIKGVPLEITLDDFRNLPHPDGRAAKVACTGEKTSEGVYAMTNVDTDVFDSVEKKLGVVYCVWIETQGQYIKGWTSGLSLASTGYALTHYHFAFVSDPQDGKLKLYEFHGESNAAALGGTVEALTTKFGPGLSSTGSVQNKIGNTFSKTTVTWANPLALLQVEDKWVKIDDLAVRLVDLRLSAVVAAARKAQDASQKNPI